MSHRPPRHPPTASTLLAASLLVAGGCGAELVCPQPQDVASTFTVSTLDFATDKPATSWVEHGYLGSDTFTSPATGAGVIDHQHTVLGLAAGLSNWYRLVVQYDGGEEAVCEGTIDVSGPPNSVPEYEVTLNQEGATASRFVLVSNAGVEDAAPVVMDREGNVVWYGDKEDAIAHTQMEFVLGGTDLMFIEQDVDHIDAELSAIVVAGFDGVELDRWSATGGHHSFVQLPDGAVAWLAVDIRDWTDPGSGEVHTVVADTVIERATDGTTSEVWSAWDHLDPALHQDWDNPYYPDMKDWTHGNSLSYHQDSDTYLVSLGNLDMVIELARDTGAVTGMFGPGITVFESGAPPFDFQHGVHWTEDGTMLMSASDRYIFSIEYAVDREANTFTEVWSYGRELNIIAAALGEAERLSNGSTMVSFGMAGGLHEVAEDGTLVWAMQGKTGIDRLSSPRLFDDFYTGE